MRELDDGSLLFSATDLSAFLGCRHASALSYRSLREELKQDEDSEQTARLFERGIDHERRHLERLRKEGKGIAEIPDDIPLAERVGRTLDAMRAGRDVIYQAALRAGNWMGYADFLVRCEARTGLGGHGYEVWDTKLAREPKASHVLQVTLYSHLLADAQGAAPECAHLVMGEGDGRRFRVAEHLHYCRRVMRRLEEFMASSAQGTYPDPCAHCETCRWRKSQCEKRWEEENAVCLTANIRRSQIRALRQIDVLTVDGLAKCKRKTPPPGIGEQAFDRLRSQAQFQEKGRKSGKPKFEAHSGEGFALLPPPDANDVFFDIEGYPFHPGGGLEYLFGVQWGRGSAAKYEALWAHSGGEERRAFERLVGKLARWKKRKLKKLNKGAGRPHIYHYAPYETAALKRLMGRHATCEPEIDDLLRGGDFVDLYAVVRKSVRVSERGYGLKKLERFFGAERDEAITAGDDSIVAYERWLETGEQALLDDIEEYNRRDCSSTEGLCDWLLKIRGKWPLKDAMPQVAGSPSRGEKKETELERNAREDAALRDDLMAESAEGGPHALMADLIGYHDREKRPEYWSMFERMSNDDEEILEDPKCIAYLRLGQQKPEDEEEGKVTVVRYTFPAQQTKLKEGSRVSNVKTADSISEIRGIEHRGDGGEAKLAATRKLEAMGPGPFSVGPDRPIETKALRLAVRDVAEDLLSGTEHHRCVIDLLRRDPPRTRCRAPGESLVRGSDTLGSAEEVVLGMDRSWLFIQGPPGTGKTYSSAKLIAKLIGEGHKVGVSSNSHKAIHNLLDRIVGLAEEEGFSFSGVKKASRANGESQYEDLSEMISNVFAADEVAEEIPRAQLFAGTAWLFADKKMRDALDYLFVDEAGQIPLANAVAMGTAAANLVLVGDHMQLGPPIQAAHPEQAGQSVLSYLLGDKATVPDDRGIFLDKTFRLCPEICRFTSESFYEGRLAPHPAAPERELVGGKGSFPRSGLVVIPVCHENCVQDSEAEADVLLRVHEMLLGWKIRESGEERALTEKDVLAVAPYNVQVNRLGRSLPSDRVGTIDKFQGKEAPAVLLSMTTSRPEDIPRSIDFLFSLNRLNVAISRAQCLSVVAMNPSLLDAPCTKVEDLRLISAFCRLYDDATVVSADSLGPA